MERKRKEQKATMTFNGLEIGPAFKMQKWNGQKIISHQF